MSIYKKYWTRDVKSFQRASTVGYMKFMSEIKKYYQNGHDYITTDYFFVLIRRYAPIDRWKLEPKSYYFKFWIKIAEKEGYIQQTKEIGSWKITSKIIEIYDEPKIEPPKKFPKHCPACNSERLKVNPTYGMECKKCGFKNKVDWRK